MSIPSFLNILPISYTFSNPPTINRFKYNSFAILIYISKFNVLWCVLNGLALAPPAIVLKIGVSTSKNPLLSKYSFNALIALLRLIKLSFTSGFTIKSTYLWRYLRSGSFSPACLSGNGCKDFVNKVTSLAFTVISPLCVLNTVPVTPIISPIS